MSKYIVHRSDGLDVPGEKHAGDQYLVLDLTHDETARAAAIAYGALRLAGAGVEPADEEDRQWLLLLIEQVRALPPLWPGGESGPTARSGPSSPA